VQAIPIIFQRHPIDRASSVYQFGPGGNARAKNSEIAQRGDFRKYVAWCLEDWQGRRQGGVVIRNYQVMHLSDASFRDGYIYRAETKEQDLVEALFFLVLSPSWELWRNSKNPSDS
jgi:hypothetical protein